MGIFAKINNMLANKSPVESSTPNEVDNPVLDAVIHQIMSIDFDTLASSDSYKLLAEKSDEIYQEIIRFSDKQKIQLLLKLVPHLHAERCAEGNHWPRITLIDSLITRLMAKKIIFEDDDIKQLIACFIAHSEPYTRTNLFIYVWPVNELLGHLVKQRKGQVISNQLTATLSHVYDLCNQHRLGSKDKDKKRITTKLDALLTQNSQLDGQIQPVYFYNEDAFADLANEQLAMLAQDNEHWFKIMALAQKTTGAKPSAKFITEAKKHIELIGEESFCSVVNEWFQLIINSKDTIPENRHYVGSFMLSANNVDMVKGLVWMFSGIQDESQIPTLAALADRCFQKIPNKGHASDALGNACLYALFHAPGLEGIAQLSRLQLRVKQNKTQQLIENYLSDAAEKRGMSISELEDLSVPGFDLNDGKRVWQFEAYTAEVAVMGVGKTETSWFKPDGNPQKTVPTFVKQGFADEFKQLKNIAKQIEQTLTAQRDRIDRLFRANRSMSWAHFQTYYIHHPLLSFLAKKLIWNFTENEQTIAAIYVDGEWRNNVNQVVKLSANCTLSLWHPALATANDVLLWRDFLMDHLIQQPLKQAFREVYLLTEAEVNTKSYSNRMAAHILKQHQFNSLAKGRGWSYTLMGAWDGGDAEIAEICLEAHDLYAQFWVQSVQADNAYSDSGIWNYVSTDQVRFLNLTTNEVVDLIDVPAIVFSEVMRDVDLFVGVASVGNDPNWRDSGGIPAYQAYWQSYSFGDLSELAKTRKAILERLIPRLKIRNVTEIKDKFVVVKGKLRTYKIHIGSTNILMEPNDQYLCIVPNQHKANPTENLFLPFEGDSGLSIILSKAFLLAEDDKITDSTITSQLELR
jgi:hypothetical protein